MTLDGISFFDIPPEESATAQKSKKHLRTSSGLGRCVRKCFLFKETAANAFRIKRPEIHRKCKTAAFCHFSPSQAPSVTLTRATFLPEEGNGCRTALPQKATVRNLGFKNSDFAFAFSVAQRKKLSANIGSLREGAGAKRLKEPARLSFFAAFAFGENTRSTFSQT